MGIEQVGVGCPDLGTDILGGGAVGPAIRIIEVGDEATYWECVGRIPPQGGTQADREAIYPSGRRNGRSGTTGGAYLRLPPPEHSGICYCNQAHYGPVSGIGEETRYKDI